MSSHPLTRRALLQVAASVAASAIVRQARASDAPTSPAPASAVASGGVVASGGAVASGSGAAASRVARVMADERGVTLFLELEHAPFPAVGSPYRDSTVIVFVPRHHRVGPGDDVSFVVHFHGHNTTAERAMVAHELREQLFDSKQNAILVVPELAVLAPDSSAGKLEAPGALGRMLDDVLLVLQTHEARAALGASVPFVFAGVGRVCVSAHSGGYHAAACAVRSGGVRVQEVWLFDALYADADVFRDWVIAGKGQPMSARHKLVSYFTSGTTETNTNRLFVELEQAGVVCAREAVEGTLSREQLTHSEAVSIRSRVGHGRVTSELNSLRDCLYASALRRRLRTSWFDLKRGARPLERRRQP